MGRDEVRQLTIPPIDVSKCGFADTYRFLKHRGEHRPANLKNHCDFAHYYDGSAGAAPQCVADDVEPRYREKVARK